MFEFKDGGFFIRGTEQAIDLADLGSKLLNDIDWLNPATAFDTLFNKFFNGIIWIAQALFELFVKTYDLLGNSGGAVDMVIVKIIDQNASTFQTIFGAVRWYALIALFIYAFYTQIARRGSGVKIIMLGVLSMVFVQQLYTAPPEFNQEAYSFSGGVSVSKEERAQPRTYVSKMYYGISTALDGIQKEITAGLLKESSNQVLVTYFEQAIWEPYKGMNADWKMEGGYNLTDEQLIALFAYRDNDKEYKILGEKIEDVVGTEEEPKVKNIRTLGSKMKYILVMLIEVPLLGIILNGLSLLAFVLKIGILLLFIGFPYILATALFPFFWNVLWNITRTIGYAMTLSALIGAGATLLVLFNATLSSILLNLTGQDIVFSLFLRLIIYYLLWKFRSQIVRIFKGRRLAPAGRMLGRFKKNVQQTAQKGLGLITKPALAGGLMAIGAGKIGAEKLSHAYRQNRNQRSINKHMAQGDSFEVALQKTEKGQEIRTLRRKEPMKQVRGAGNRTKALAYHLLSRGYRDNTAGNQHYRQKGQGALLRIQKDKIDTLDRKRRIKSLDRSIRHQQGIDEFKKNWRQPEQPVIESSGAMFIDFRNRTFTTKPKVPKGNNKNKQQSIQQLRKKEVTI